MHINEVVVTEHCFDIGLCIGEISGVPVIAGRNSRYGRGEYGGVQQVKWLGTGTFCSLDYWDKMTDTSMSVQTVMNVLGISNKCLYNTKCIIESQSDDAMCDRLLQVLKNSGCVKKHKAAKLSKLIFSEFIVNDVYKSK